MAVKNVTKAGLKRAKGKAPAAGRRAARAKGARGLSRTALDFLVANSPTPEIFNEVPKRPPFDVQDH